MPNTPDSYSGNAFTNIDFTDLAGSASIAALRSGHEVFASSKRICALVCGAGPEGTAS